MKISFTLDWERALHWFHGYSLLRKRIVWVVYECVCSVHVYFFKAKCHFHFAHIEINERMKCGCWLCELNVSVSEWMSVCLPTVSPSANNPYQMRKTFHIVFVTGMSSVWTFLHRFRWGKRIHVQAKILTSLCCVTENIRHFKLLNFRHQTQKYTR